MGKKPVVGLVSLFWLTVSLTGCQCGRQGANTQYGGSTWGGPRVASRGTPQSQGTNGATGNNAGQSAVAGDPGGRSMPLMPGGQGNPAGPSVGDPGAVNPAGGVTQQPAGPAPGSGLQPAGLSTPADRTGSVGSGTPAAPTQPGPLGPLGGQSESQRPPVGEVGAGAPNPNPTPLSSSVTTNAAELPGGPDKPATSNGPAAAADSGSPRSTPRTGGIDIPDAPPPVRMSSSAGSQSGRGGSSSSTSANDPLATPPPPSSAGGQQTTPSDPQSSQSPPPDRPAYLQGLSNKGGPQ